MTDEKLLEAVRQVAAAAQRGRVIKASRANGKTVVELEFDSAVDATEFLQACWRLDLK